MLSLYIRENLFTKFIDKSASLERKLQYYEAEIYKREHFKETRILGLYPFVKSRFDDTLQIFCDEKWKTQRKSQSIEICLRFVTLLGYFGILILMLDSLMKGYIFVGAFAAIFSSISTMIAFMDDAVRNYLGNMMENFGSLKIYMLFLNLDEEQGEDKEIHIEEGISLQNVAFKYPKVEKYALKNINLNIKKGETFAFVGENGAGKTTLVRILTGILKPTNGDVKYDKVSIFSINKNFRFKNITGVGQKFGKYKMTMRKNVVLSDRQKEISMDKIDYVLNKVDIDTKNNSFSNGIETMLSKEFDGMDISGGQWQIVALARGLYKDSELIVLDEPTSAIDPIEETALYKKFKQLAKGKTAIIVTHKLGSARIADKIVVMKFGEILENVKNMEQAREVTEEAIQSISAVSEETTACSDTVSSTVRSQIDAVTQVDETIRKLLQEAEILGESINRFYVD